MYRRMSLIVFAVTQIAIDPSVYAQTAEGDILRGKGVFAAGVGWYNLNSAKGNAINVRAMRNYNEEVRLNYINRVKFYAEKKAGRKVTQEEAAKRAQQRIAELRNNPSIDDIRNGDALNLLAVMLTDPDVKQQDWYQSAVPLPDKATLKDIVFQYYPNKMSDKDVRVDIALSRISKNVDWPLVFKTESFADERAAYENAVSKVRGTVIMNRFDPNEITIVDKCLEKLTEEIQKTYANDKRGFKATALAFQAELKSATKLFDGAVLDYAKDILQETNEYDAKSVGELMAFMLRYRLFFAPADSPRSTDLYDKLFKAMDEQATKLGVKTIAIDGAEKVDSSDGKIPSDLKTLFNGKDLTEWDGDPILWSVKEGVIHGETTEQNPAKGNTFIIWKDGVVKDFELRLSFRCNATNNSGIQYRSKHITDASVKNKWVVRGYQHELRNEDKFPNTSSFIYDEGGKRGRICMVGEKAYWSGGKKVIESTFLDEAGFQKLMKVDDWNDVVIIGKGKNIKHYLNGKLVLDFTDNDPQLALSEGVLALQLHAGKPMWAEFKNIRLKELK